MTKKCPRCGNEDIEENHNFCMICGLKLIPIDKRIEEIKERLYLATKGPWRKSNSAHIVVSDYPVPEIRGSDAVEHYGGHMIAESVSSANANFIANAWQDINFLLSLIESLIEKTKI